MLDNDYQKYLDNLNNFFIVNENFENEYNNWNKIDREGYFLLGEAKESLISIGLLKQSIVIDKSKILKILNKHNEMSDEIIKQIPNILNKPTLILKSQSVKGRIVVFGEVYDKINNPVMVAMELNPDENKNNINKIYKVASAYGRKNILYIQNWLSNPNNILFVDNKKNRTNTWLNGLGLQLPVPYNKKSSTSNSLAFNTDMVNITIKNIPVNERPRERALKDGVEYLSNEELIAIILKTGTKNYNVKTLSSKILSNLKDIHDLKNITVSSLTLIPGIGKVKAIELLAALELGKRVYYNVNKTRVKLNNSKKIFEYFKDIFINENQENFYAIYLDSKSKLISYRLLFKGTINTSCVHPREIFKYAFLESAYSIIVMHNHPSGDSSPSKEDEEVTSTLFNIGKMMAIPVVDHIVFGKEEYFSFYEYYCNNKNTM